MTAPTIAERIADYLGNGGLWNPEAMEHDKVRTLLIDCRDYLQSIESQPVPVEPEIYWIPIEDGTHPVVDLQDYRNLQSALKRAQDELDMTRNLLNGVSEQFEEEKERRAKTEELNRRMVELLKEPSANMKSAGYGKPDYLAIFKAMSAELLKEVEK